MNRPAGFDFSGAMRLLCRDICSRLPVFQHIHMDQVAVGFAQTRSTVTHGLQAKLTPLKFENGSEVKVFRGRRYSLPPMRLGGQQQLYILTFYLPRFLEHDLREKLLTVCHELYHISPNFNGDIRRFSGRYHVHSHSHDEFDRIMGEYADEYLAACPPQEIWHFLTHNFRSLQATHGNIYGHKFPIPRLVPVTGHWSESRTA